MKSWILKVFLIFLFLIAFISFVYKLFLKYKQDQEYINNKKVVEKYKKEAKEDAELFIQIPLATESDLIKINDNVTLIKGFRSSRETGAIGVLHVIVNNNIGILPKKAMALKYYFDLKQDNNMNCFNWDKYDSQIQTAYTGGIKGVTQDWSGSKSLTSADIILNYQGKDVVVKNMEIKGICMELHD